MRRVYIIVGLIFIAGFSKGVIFSKGLHDVDFNNSKTLLGSTFEVMLKIEGLGVDITELNEKLDFLLSTYADIEYYYVIGDENKTDILYKNLYDGLVELNNYSFELFGKSITDYQIYRNNIIIKSISMDVLYLVILYIIWRIIDKYYYDSIKHKDIMVVQ